MQVSLLLIASLTWNADFFLSAFLGKKKNTKFSHLSQNNKEARSPSSLTQTHQNAPLEVSEASQAAS